MRSTWLGILSLVGAVAAAGAQTAAPLERREARGRVVTPGDSGDVRPVPGTWVTLHRIAPDRAGPVDSVRTDADGRYAISYEASPDDSASWVASAFRAGIAHFSPPFEGGTPAGDRGEIIVFDTTSATADVHVRGRHLVVYAAKPGAARQVMEVYELDHHGARTAVARGDTVPVWSAPLPPGAREPRVGEADIAADGVRFRGGRAEVLAPLPPGLRQLAIRYELPATAFPFRLALREDTEFLEVLVEDPFARVTGAGLAEVDRASVDGHELRRYLSRRVAAGAAVRVELPTAATARRAPAVALVVAISVVAMSAAFVVAMRRAPDRVLAAPAGPG